MPEGGKHQQVFQERNLFPVPSKRESLKIGFYLRFFLETTVKIKGLADVGAVHTEEVLIL